MQSIHEQISQVDSEFSLLDGILQDIYLIELPIGKIVLDLKFECSLNYDDNLIGGLAATIQSFSGVLNKGSHRSINLEKLNLIFQESHGFLILFAVDPDYPASQFTSALNLLTSCFYSYYNVKEFENATDRAAVSLRSILLQVSDDLNIEFKTGTATSLLPYKLLELAEELSSSIFGNLSMGAPKRLNEVSIKTEVNKLFSGLLDSFKQLHQVTLINTTEEGEMEEFTKSKLEDAVVSNLYNTVIGMLDTVSLLIEMENEADRSVDLDDRWVYFTPVGSLSFIYLVVESKQTIDLIAPVLNRIAGKIVSMLELSPS